MIKPITKPITAPSSLKPKDKKTIKDAINKDGILSFKLPGTEKGIEIPASPKNVRDEEKVICIGFKFNDMDVIIIDTITKFVEEMRNFLSVQ